MGCEEDGMDISKERSDRFDYEEKHPCPGGLSHVCIQCGESYDCYACPDIVNPSYSQTTCRPCLIKLIRGE
jgi:hypothetical protein